MSSSSLSSSFQASSSSCSSSSSEPPKVTAESPTACPMAPNANTHPSDPHANLAKAIKLDRRHTNFQFNDEAYGFYCKISYPPPTTDIPPNEHCLKQLWAHVDSYYFQSLMLHEMNRLDYLRAIVEQPTDDAYPGRHREKQLYNLIDRTFTPYFLDRKKKGRLETLDHDNWFQNIYLCWQEARKHKKLGEHKLYSNRHRKRARLFVKYATADLKTKETILKNERELVASMQDESDNSAKQLGRNDNVLKEIQSSKKELEIINSSNKQLLMTLLSRVNIELAHDEVICTVNTDEDAKAYAQKYSVSTAIRKRETAVVKRARAGEVQRKYLAYAIPVLQRVQVAESICRVLRYDPPGRYLVDFEPAMALKPVYIPEKNFLLLNSLREFSLFKFQTVSIKSPYSIMSPNYYGFRCLYEQREEHWLKRKDDIQELIKKNKNSSQACDRQFLTFGMCHNCKQLFKEPFLVSCQYSSETSGVPAKLPSYFDAYSFAFQSSTSMDSNDKSRAYNWFFRFQQQGKDHLFNSIPIFSFEAQFSLSIDYLTVSQPHDSLGDLYLCERKYCRNCARSSGGQSFLSKKGLCTFCEKTCICTRCSRNDNIIRMKSLYALLGGNVAELRDDFVSLVLGEQDNFIVKKAQPTAIMPATDSNAAVQPRKKGRPAKQQQIKPMVSSQRHNDYLQCVRFYLQELRMMCDLGKRRQKQKYLLAELQSQKMHKTLEFYLGEVKSKEWMNSVKRVAKRKVKKPRGKKV